MEFLRSAGVLLHPTSLPGKFGIGELGSEIYNFINFLRDSGQTLWQVFPLGPTGYGDSPYQCFSAFAGNPLLISLEKLKEEDLLNDEDLESLPSFNPLNIDFGIIIPAKTKLLRKAFNNYKANGSESAEQIKSFNDSNSDWLNDFALFMACKNYHNGVQWTAWEKEIAFREKGAVEKWSGKLSDEIEYQKFVQYKFYKQWKDVKNFANENGIKIIGDLPIFISYDSADLWANKNLFSVNQTSGKLETVAGVPPDYFSETGQLWGNPLYKWDVMEADNFSWWKKRIIQMYELVDIVRIDHFRGFEAYYEIPGDAITAQTGKWVKAPGVKLFKEIKNALGDVPIVAEDLGVITKEVEELRDMFNFPGMKILQFAFGEEGDKGFLPHNHKKNCVVYSGSHDNDTTRGFFENEKNNGTGIYEWAQKYLNYYNDDICGAVVNAAYASVADTVIIPMQDLLKLGTEARMNFPGRLGGNWTWRFTWEQIPNELPIKLKEITNIYERDHKTKIKTLE